MFPSLSFTRGGLLDVIPVKALTFLILVSDCFFFCRREWFDVVSLQNLWRFVKRHFLYVLLGRQDAHLSSLRQLEEERSVQEETLSWAGRLEEEHHECSRDWDLF